MVSCGDNTDLVTIWCCLPACINNQEIPVFITGNGTTEFLFRPGIPSLIVIGHVTGIPPM